MNKRLVSTRAIQFSQQFEVPVALILQLREIRRANSAAPLLPRVAKRVSLMFHILLTHYTLSHTCRDEHYIIYIDR